MLLIFELLPVVLAAIAVVLCGMRYSAECKRSVRIPMLMGVVCGMLLIIAQTSWWTSIRIEGAAFGTPFADALWTAFNSIVMGCFIYMAWPKKCYITSYLKIAERQNLFLPFLC